MIFEYVVSGAGHALTTHDILLKGKGDFLGYLTKFKQMLADKGEYDFSFLYNGYLEAKMGKCLHNTFGESAKFYVDLGGLQMVALGHTVTDELKLGVYEVQADCGDYAMSFDEIPVVLLAEKSTRGGMSSRVVDVENFDSYAIESAKNLKEQIRVFKASNDGKGTVARPFMIIQGYSLESYQRWVDTLLSELDDDEIEYIGGVACGAAALGQGQLEDFKRAYICANIVLPQHIKNHIHLLGVGSITRLIPYVMLYNNGTLKTERISFDSSTHSSALSMANFQYGPKLLSLSGSSPRGGDVVVDNLEEFYSNFGAKYSRQYIHDSYFLPTSKLVEKYGDEFRAQYQHHKLLNLFCNVYNFMGEVDKLMKHPEQYIVNNFPARANQFLSFANVVDDLTLSEWISYNKSAVPSNPVKHQSPSIGVFFE